MHCLYYTLHVLQVHVWKVKQIIPELSLQRHQKDYFPKHPNYCLLQASPSIHLSEKFWALGYNENFYLENLMFIPINFQLSNPMLQQVWKTFPKLLSSWTASFSTDLQWSSSGNWQSKIQKLRGEFPSKSSLFHQMTSFNTWSSSYLGHHIWVTNPLTTTLLIKARTIIDHRLPVIHWGKSSGHWCCLAGKSHKGSSALLDNPHQSGVLALKCTPIWPNESPVRKDPSSQGPDTRT